MGLDCRVVGGFLGLCTLAMVGVAAGCTSSESASPNNCPSGSESCPCRYGGDCDPGLTCLSKVCVAAGNGGEGGSNGEGGSAAGQGGQAGEAGSGQGGAAAGAGGATAGAGGSMAGSGGAGQGGQGGSGGSTTKDWYSSTCSELGGMETALGACYVPCSAGCPAPAKCNSSYLQSKCDISSCSSDSDCGPKGWTCETWGACYLRCTTPTEGQSPECPLGWECSPQDMGTKRPFCVKSSAPPGQCGEPCPSGCCSTTGLTCCQPPYCGGDKCLGSPCC